MATPQQLRDDTAAVSALAVEQMGGLIAGLPDEAVREAMSDVLPGLIVEFQNAASVLAAEWYDEFRSDLDVPGSHAAFLPDFRDPGVEEMLRWAESESQSMLPQIKLIEGGVIRRVVNGSRETVIGNAAKDPQALGHQRYARSASAGACSFCRLLAGRGTVYRSEQSASFGAHDSCGCVAVVAFSDRPIPVRPYEASTKNITDADRARVRDWLRDQ